MGTWSGLTGLYFRETTGSSGVSAGTSLALTASLMQFTHLGDGNLITKMYSSVILIRNTFYTNTMISGEGNGRQPSEGPKAKGPTPFTRTYQLKKSPEHWLYVVANCDLSYEFTIFENVQQALKELADRGFTAVEVLSCRKIAERGLDSGNF